MGFPCIIFIATCEPIQITKTMFQKQYNILFWKKEHNIGFRSRFLSSITTQEPMTLSHFNFQNHSFLTCKMCRLDELTSQVFDRFLLSRKVCLCKICHSPYHWFWVHGDYFKSGIMGISNYGERATWGICFMM